MAHGSERKSLSDATKGSSSSLKGGGSGSGSGKGSKGAKSSSSQMGSGKALRIGLLIAVLAVGAVKVYFSLPSDPPLSADELKAMETPVEEPKPASAGQPGDAPSAPAPPPDPNDMPEMGAPPSPA